MSEEDWRKLDGRGRLYGLDSALPGSAEWDGGLSDQEIGQAEMLILNNKNLNFNTYVSQHSRKAATAQLKALIQGMRGNTIFNTS